MYTCKYLLCSSMEAAVVTLWIHIRPTILISGLKYESLVLMIVPSAFSSKTVGSSINMPAMNHQGVWANSYYCLTTAFKWLFCLGWNSWTTYVYPYIYVIHLVGPTCSVIMHLPDDLHYPSWRAINVDMLCLISTFPYCVADGALDQQHPLTINIIIPT